MVVNGEKRDEDGTVSHPLRLTLRRGTHESADRSRHGAIQARRAARVEKVTRLFSNNIIALFLGFVHLRLPWVSDEVLRPQTPIP